MRITDLIKKQGIILDASVKTKQEAFDVLVELQEKSGHINDKEEYMRGILAREEQGSTAIGEGLAIPHSKNKAVCDPGLAVLTVKDGIDCDSLDGEPTRLFFMIAAPEAGGDLHIDMLSNLTMMLMDETFKESLIAATTPEEFLNLINEKESEQFGEATEEKKEKEQEEAKAKSSHMILAVTACPTGIAHTYMAAEALENKGKELGYFVKAETNGSGGVKNVLTKEEIEQADGIIIAADKNVEMARFDGKPLIKVKVQDGVHKPQELIERIVSGDAPIYHHTGEVKEESTEKESFGRQLYKHLMNGVSHMLPFVIGGGILIALAFLLDNYAIDPGNFGSNTPLAAFFKRTGDVAFGFMLPILAGYIAMSIADRPGLAAGIVGGMLAKTGMTFTAEAGVSAGFLGALFAGFTAGYFVLGLKKICNHLPDALEGIKPVLLYPLIGVLGISIIMCAVNPAMGSLNELLKHGLDAMGGSSKVLLGCVLGGMMAIDMGGPFNKAAYVFGTAAIESGNFDIMAAVMVGGMIPPLVIALSTTFFKGLWSESDRKPGIVNYIMGLCFISEGAIPFAAADPLRVIPSCIVGSAVAGGLSMYFGCGLRAPHGGIFVFPVVDNVAFYILALVVGSIVGMLVLSLLKKMKK